MTRTPELDPNLRAWLGDEETDHQPDALTDALDALYAAGPAPETERRAARALREVLAAGPLYYATLPHTALGEMHIAVSERGLAAVDFGVPEGTFLEELHARTGRPVLASDERTRRAAAQLREYLDGLRTDFDLPVDLESLTDFQRQVLLAARQVPRGKVATYGQIARNIGRPRAARAVGQALGRNPVPVVIPCHRVIASDGSLGGYSGGGGLASKRLLLQLEGARLI